MDYYDTDRIIRHLTQSTTEIAPSREEWTKLCWALKTLNYGVETFAQISLCSEKESRDKWNSERNFRMDEDKAKGVIVGLCKSAGIDLTPFRVNNPSTFAPRRPTAREDFAGIPTEDTAPALPPIYVEPDTVSRMEGNKEKTTLYNFLCGLFPSDEVREVFSRYRVGGTTHFGTTPGMASAFPFINSEGNCVDIHLQPYDEDGHRWKKTEQHPFTQHWEMAKRKKSDRRAPWCLFGEHLLRDNPTAPIGIVESEKTALICALYFPRYIWMATQSLTNLNARRCQAVRDRDVYVFPDRDGIAKWRERATALHDEGFRIFFCGEIITRRAANPKDDLGDLVLSDLNRPKVTQPTQTDLKTENR